MKNKLTTFILALMLGFSFQISCLGQKIQNIPVHFHVFPSIHVTSQQLDDQIKELNSVYAAQGTPFRFQRSSVDNVPVHLGNLAELNVKILPIPGYYGVTRYLASEAQTDPTEDFIYLNPESLPSFASKMQGIVLVHEVGHWLGLPHDYGTITNCMNNLGLSPLANQCVFTDGQKTKITTDFNQFRLTRR